MRGMRIGRSGFPEVQNKVTPTDDRGCSTEGIDSCAPLHLAELRLSKF